MRLFSLPKRVSVVLARTLLLPANKSTMKKGLLLIAIVAIIVVVYFVFFNKSDDQATASKKVKPVALSISKNPEVFNTAFSVLLNNYYTLKDALVNADSTKAATDALAVVKAADAIPLDSLTADSSIVLTAKNFTGVLATEGNNVNKATSLEAQRRSFAVISDNLYSLLNTVRYDKEVVYHDLCPMAFNDEEQAYWLSRDSAIVNPYLGNKHPKYKSSMLVCGTLEDSVNFVGK